MRNRPFCNEGEEGEGEGEEEWEADREREGLCWGNLRKEWR